MHSSVENESESLSTVEEGQAECSCHGVQILCIG